MKYWSILTLCLLSGAFVGAYVIWIYSFNHFESVVIGMITITFVYIMLRLNELERKIDILLGD